MKLTVTVFRGIKLKMGAVFYKANIRTGAFLRRMPVEELTTVVDQLTNTVIKPFSDAVTVLQDKVVLSATKAVSDLVSSAEAMTFSLTARRMDSVTVVELVGKKITKTFSDFVTTIDNVHFDPLVEAPPITDSMSVNDKHVFSMTRPLQEVVSVSDAGKGSLQNYASDYFASDYVGRSFTF